MKLMVTGAAGFIGSNFVQRLLRVGGDTVVAVDALTYAGNLANLEPIKSDPRLIFVKADICDAGAIGALMEEHGFDAVVNFAAESHVDRSILGAAPFIRTNIEGTRNLLDLALKHKVPRFLQVSTDEVYGSLGPTGKFTEDTPIQPSSPYSASKASADLLVQAWHHTFGLDAVITRCSNNYGPYQFPEKLIPLMIINAMQDKPLPVYGDGLNVRDWIHVEDHCRGVDLVLRKGQAGRVYNLGGNNEQPNIAVVKGILHALGKPESLIKYVRDRPGHDRRYAIDGTRIERELGFVPETKWPQGLEDTIDWYKANEPWWAGILSGAYRDYYAEQYGESRG